MTKIKDGGPAFPHDGQVDYTGGMTLRDYFAAKAMQAMIIGNSASIAVCSRPGAIGVSKDAYIFADVMLTERERAE